MDSGTDDVWTVARVREVTVRLSGALAASNQVVANQLAAAAGEVRSEREALLVMRSALIATRPTWEDLDNQSLVSEVKGALAAGKRLAVDLD